MEGKGREREGKGEEAFPIFLLLIDKADIWNSSPIPQWQVDGGERKREAGKLACEAESIFFS